MKRRYELKERARRKEETRQRIVEAAVGLHTSIGPGRTTVKAIAEHAGVERHTVYAHFPDERTLFQACSSHWRERNPRPALDPWLEVDDPAERLRGLLADIYSWYEQVEGDLALFIRDADLLPANAEALQADLEATAELAREAARGWPRRKVVRAAIGHAVEFETWRSLVRHQGLTSAQAADTMVAFARGV